MLAPSNIHIYPNPIPPHRVTGTGLILGVTPAEESVLFGCTLSLSQWRYLRSCGVARMDSMKGGVEREPWQRAPPPSMHVPAVVSGLNSLKGLLIGAGEKSQKVEKSLSSSRDKAPLNDAATVIIVTPALKRFKTNSDNKSNSSSNGSSSSSSSSSSSLEVDPGLALRLHASLTSKQPRSRPTSHYPTSSSSSTSMGVLSWSLDTTTTREREPSRDGKYNHAQLGKTMYK